MRRALAEPFRYLWHDTALLRIVVAVALVVTGLNVLQSLVAVIAASVFGPWQFGFDDWWWVIAWYISPLIHSVIVFVAVVIISALILRAVRRRQQTNESAEL